jgi:hypothetical protein
MRRWLPLAWPAAVVLAAVFSAPGSASQKVDKASQPSSYWANSFRPSFRDSIGAEFQKVFPAPDGGALLLVSDIQHWARDETYPLLAVSRLNPWGHVLWQKVFPDIGGGDLAPTGDGGVLIASPGLVLTRLSSTGAISWSRRYAPEGNELPHVGWKLAAGRGGFYAAFCQGSNDDRSIGLFRLDGNGGVTWGRKLAGGSIGFDAVLPMPWGVLLLGRSSSYHSGFIWAAAFDFDGAGLWQRTYGVPGRELNLFRAFGREDGGFLISATSFTGYVPTRSLLRMDANGSVLWSRAFSASVRGRSPADGAGDWLVSESGLFRVGEDGHLIAAFPISWSSLGLETAAASLDGGFFLAGYYQLAKTDGRGLIEGCGMLSGTMTEISEFEWEALVSSYAVSSITASTADDSPEMSSYPGTWKVVCRDPNYYYLTIEAVEGGTTEPLPGQSPFERGATATIRALPDDFYDFMEWQGDVPAADSQAPALSLLMDRDRTIRPRFQKIQAPLNLTGSRLRSAMRPWAFDALTWAPHPENSNVESYRVFAVRDGVETLLGETPAAVCQYVHRRASPGEAASYAVCAVTASGREGYRATIEVR